MVVVVVVVVVVDCTRRCRCSRRQTAAEADNRGRQQKQTAEADSRGRHKRQTTVVEFVYLIGLASFLLFLVCCFSCAQVLAQT